MAALLTYLNNKIDLNSLFSVRRCEIFHYDYGSCAVPPRSLRKNGWLRGAFIFQWYWIKTKNSVRIKFLHSVNTLLRFNPQMKLLRTNAKFTHLILRYYLVKWPFNLISRNTDLHTHLSRVRSNIKFLWVIILCFLKVLILKSNPCLTSLKIFKKKWAVWGGTRYFKEPIKGRRAAAVV